MKKWLYLCLVLPLFLVNCDGCSERTLPTVPSFDQLDKKAVRDSWLGGGSPGNVGVVIHTPGYEQGSNEYKNQMEATRQLQQAGCIGWVRLDAPYGGNENSNWYYKKARELGLSIFTIITLGDLETHGWNDTIDYFARNYPSSMAFEIAGEITNTDPSVNPTGTMDPIIYMTKLKAMYAYAMQNHPELRGRITSAPTFGSGTGGAKELQTFFENGLFDLDGIIVAINVYTDIALVNYANVLNNPKFAQKLARHEVWVTECGQIGTTQQIAFMESVFSRLRSMLHARNIFWYSMYDANDANAYGLIYGISDENFTPRPLFAALIDSTQGTSAAQTPNTPLIVNPPGIDPAIRHPHSDGADENGIDRSRRKER